MPTIQSATQVVDIAKALLDKTRPFFHRITNIYRRNGSWIVEVDVGLFQPLVGQITIDAATGDVMEVRLP